MTRVTLILFIVILILSGSCSGRKKKLDSKNLIPEKELVSILTDLYLTDGLLPLPKIRSLFPHLDSVATYHQIIMDHGYSKENMDKTMKYYFYRDPKKLVKIYDEVLGKLSKMESLAEKEVLLKTNRNDNRWPGKEFYSLHAASCNDSIWFDIPLNKRGVYTLTFTAILFPDDQSVKPRITAYSCNPDSIITGKINYVKPLNYIKDGRSHTYSFIIDASKSNLLHFRGLLYDFDSNPMVCEKHAIFEGISVNFVLAGV